VSDKLPPGWVWGTIGDVAIVNPTTRKASIPDDLNVSFVPMAAVTEVSGRINLSEARPARVLKPKSYRSFVDGDVLVAKITPSMENGKAAVARGLENSIGFGSTEFHVLRPLETMFAKYLFHYVVRESFRAKAARAMTGTAGQLRVPPDFLRTAPIPIAPPAEQERIVAAIDEHFSRLDAAEATLRQILTRLDALRSAILADAFNPHRQLPSRWQIERLEDLLDHSIGGLWGSPAGEDEHDVAVIRVTELQDHGTLSMRTAAKRSVTKRQLSSRLLRIGDLVLEKSGGGPTTPVGRVALFPGHTRDAICTNFMQLMRPNTELVQSGFLHWQLHFRYVSGATAPLNKGSGNIRNLQTKEYLRQLVALPPMHEQIRISRGIEERFARTRQLELAVSEALARLAGLRRSVLAAAFSGQLGTQDPDDEPASVLLERIAASRLAKPARRRMGS